MANQLSALNELCEVAHGAKDRESRRALLRRVTDIFLNEPGSYTDQQRLLFGDIMEKLAYDLEMQVREELARRIAAESGAPHSLVKRLAFDEVFVARPVLERSPVLTEQDLLELTKCCGQDHLLAITKRKDIGFRLSAVLVDRGEDGVVASLVGNDNARISTTTVEEVAKRAETSEPLQAALIERTDVPREIVMGLLEHVSEKLRHTVLDKLTDADVENLEDVVDTMRSEIESRPETAAEDHVARLEQSGQLDENALIEFAAENQAMEFLLALSRILKLEPQTVQKVITDKTGQALLIACRAGGLSSRCFKELATSPLIAVATNLHQIVPLIRSFEKLTIPEAQRTMRYWRSRKVRPEPSDEAPAELAAG